MVPFLCRLSICGRKDPIPSPQFLHHSLDIGVVPAPAGRQFSDIVPRPREGWWSAVEGFLERDKISDG